MGLDYEVGWLPVVVRGSRNPRIQPGAPGSFVAASVVPLLEVPRQRVDEPTAALDLPSAREGLELIERLRARGAAVVMITHLVDARPNLILDLNRADASLSMGIDYEVG